LTRVYRVLRRPYAHAPFDGEGAYRYGGRWSSPGTRVAYASEHESLAMVEYFVHLDADDPPPDLVLAVADVPDDLKRETIGVSKLPAHWRDTPAPAEFTHYGDESVHRAACGLLLVPSALAPSENNWLINPQHPDFRKIILRETRPLNYDPRLFHREHRSRKRK
jgi:RES domain-containing protein